MLRGCPVCDSTDINSALINERKSENGVATGVRFVCGNCSHEGPSAEMLTAGLQDRTRMFAAVLWNDFDKHDPTATPIIWDN
jgi:hypothetical protein